MNMIPIHLHRKLALMLILCSCVPIVLGQIGTQIIPGQLFSGTLYTGNQIDIYWFNFTNTQQQTFVWRHVSSIGVQVVVRYGTPPIDATTGIYDSFCAGSFDSCFLGIKDSFHAPYDGSLLCPSPTRPNGTWYVGFLNTYANVSTSFGAVRYSFTVYIDNPALELGVPKKYWIQGRDGFYIRPNLVPASTNLVLKQVTFNDYVGVGTANPGMNLYSDVNCNGFIAPGFHDDVDAVITYTLTPSTSIKNTDAFYAIKQSGFAVLSASGELPDVTSFCIILCAQGDSSCSSCDNFKGLTGGLGGQNSALGGFHVKFGAWMVSLFLLFMN